MKNENLLKIELENMKNSPIQKLFNNQEEFAVVVEKILTMGPVHERENSLLLLKNISLLLDSMGLVVPINPIEEGEELMVDIPTMDSLKMKLPIKYPKVFLKDMSESEKRTIKEGPLESVMVNALLANCFYYIDQYVKTTKR